jgi:hypothetical protein
MMAIKLAPQTKDASAATPAITKPQMIVSFTAVSKEERARAPDGAAGELLGGRGEAFEEEGRDHEEVHQHGIGRQRQRAERDALPGEQRKDQQQ